MKRLSILVLAIVLVLSSVCFGLRMDINKDGRVDFSDFAILAQEWLMSEDLVQDGVFDIEESLSPWDGVGMGGGWEIINNKAKWYDKSLSDNTLLQSLVGLEIGNTYKVKFTLSSAVFNAGHYLEVKLGDTMVGPGNEGLESGCYDTDGSYKCFVIADSNNAVISFTGVGDGGQQSTVCLDDVSVKEFRVDLRSDCVGFWKMNDNADNAIVVDSSGFGNDGLIHDGEEEKVGLDNFSSLIADANNPVISEGASGEWDEHFREIGNVLYEPDDTGKEYKAFYSGYSGDYVGDDHIGYAYSPDGITWTKVGKVISHLEDPYVLKVGETYHLYAEDKTVSTNRIRKYHSSDCENWTDDGVVLNPQSGGTPTDWEAYDVSSPVVWREDSTWYMLYEGRGGGYWGKVGLATSTDGCDWARDENNPVFDTGETGEWDETYVVPDDIIKVDDIYYLFYHGYSGTYISGYEGIATSTDLHTWVRDERNPVIKTATTVMVFYDTEYVFHYQVTGGIGRFYPCSSFSSKHHTVGKINGALTFDGIDDYITAPLLACVTKNGTYTFSALIKSVGTYDGVVFQNSHSYTNRNGLSIRSNNLEFGYYDGSWTGVSGDINENEWIHVVAVNNSGVLQLYINNVLQTATKKPYFGQYQAYMFLGTHGGSYFFTGSMDNVMIFDKALNEDEIDFLYNGGLGTESLISRSRP